MESHALDGGGRDIFVKEEAQAGTCTKRMVLSNVTVVVLSRPLPGYKQTPRSRGSSVPTLAISSGLSIPFAHDFRLKEKKIPPKHG